MITLKLFKTKSKLGIKLSSTHKQYGYLFSLLNKNTSIISSRDFANLFLTKNGNQFLMKKNVAYILTSILENKEILKIEVVSENKLII